VLPALETHALVKITASVEQSDCHDVERLIRHFLEKVAGQDPESAGVDRQRLVDAEFRAEERDRTVRQNPLGGALQVGIDDLGHSLELIQQISVSGGAEQVAFGQIEEKPHRILPRHHEPVCIDAAKELASAGGPRPEVVVGDPREILEWLGKSSGQAINRATHIARSIKSVIHSIESNRSRLGMTDGPRCHQGRRHAPEAPGCRGRFGHPRIR